MPGRSDDLIFIDDKAVDGIICRRANTVTIELNMALVDRLAALGQLNDAGFHRLSRGLFNT